jgi:hypothetical protein
MAAARMSSFPAVSFGKGFVVFTDCASVGAAVLGRGGPTISGRGGPTISGGGGPIISGGEVEGTSGGAIFCASSCWRNRSLT